MQKNINSMAVAVTGLETNDRVLSAQSAATFPPRRVFGDLSRTHTAAPAKRSSRMFVRARFLGVLLLLAALGVPLRALALTGAPSVSLAWDRSPEADVIGYRVYFGGSSRHYTNSLFVGNLTTGLVPGLSNGVSYFFAVTALDATGLESDYSSEVAVTPRPGGSSVLKVRIASSRQAVLTVSGAASQAYDILATTNLTTWTRLGSVTAGTNGQAVYTDTGAPSQRVRYYRARQTP